MKTAQKKLFKHLQNREESYNPHAVIYNNHNSVLLSDADHRALLESAYIAALLTSEDKNNNNVEQ